MRRIGLVALGVAAVLAAGAARADDLALGTRIYREGKGTEPIEASIAFGRVRTLGSRFPCVNCHKIDGLGVLEGGLQPRDVTWGKLSAPPANGGRGYDAATLARAITEGIDAQGRPLGPGMPRYRLEATDLAALVGYLQQLQPGAPGITGEAIEIATLLPLRGRRMAEARAVERFLDLAVLDINTRRRFDGRSLVRHSIPFDPDIPGDAARALEAALTNPPFAFLANLGLAPGDPARARLVAERIPEIAPLDAPLLSSDRDAIWLEPSVADQARALVEMALTDAVMPRARGLDPSRPRLAIIHGVSTEDLVAAAAARQEARQIGAVVTIDCACATAEDIVARLQRAGAGVVLLLAPAADASVLLARAAQAGARPIILGRRAELLPLERAKEAASADLFLVTGYGGVEPRSRGAYDFRRVVGELGSGHGDLLRDAYVGAKLLETALADAKAPLSRAGLREAIEQLDAFQTGVMPPLSFRAGASRRAAARVMWLDPARRRLVPLQDWHPS